MWFCQLHSLKQSVKLSDAIPMGRASVCRVHGRCAAPSDRKCSTHSWRHTVQRHTYTNTRASSHHHPPDPLHLPLTHRPQTPPSTVGMSACVCQLIMCTACGTVTDHVQSQQARKCLQPRHPACKPAVCQQAGLAPLTNPKPTLFVSERSPQAIKGPHDPHHVRCELPHHPN